MAFDHFDIGNFEASVTKYLVETLTGYDIHFNLANVNLADATKWLLIEFMGHDGEITTKAPIRHLLVHIRTRGETADSDMTAMTRAVVNALKDKWVTLYDIDTDEAIGRLRSFIIREFPKEPNHDSRGWNRSILIRMKYGLVGVAYASAQY